jgi:hypothetical protein
VLRQLGPVVSEAAEVDDLAQALAARGLGHDGGGAAVALREVMCSERVNQVVA